MRADIGAIFYALAVWLTVHSIVLMCRRTPERIPLLPWRGRRALTPESGYSIAGAFVLGFAVASLDRPHVPWWIEVLILALPIVIAQHIVIVRHNRDVARAESLGLHPERSLTGPNSAL